MFNVYWFIFFFWKPASVWHWQFGLSSRFLPALIRVVSTPQFSRHFELKKRAGKRDFKMRGKNRDIAGKIGGYEIGPDGTVGILFRPCVIISEAHCAASSVKKDRTKISSLKLAPKKEDCASWQRGGTLLSPFDLGISDLHLRSPATWRCAVPICSKYPRTSTDQPIFRNEVLLWPFFMMDKTIYYMAYLYQSPLGNIKVLEIHRPNCVTRSSKVITAAIKCKETVF